MASYITQAPSGAAVDTIPINGRSAAVAADRPAASNAFGSMRGIPGPSALGAPRVAPRAGVDGETLVSLFMASLARQPDDTAVISADGALSYRELARHAAYVRNVLAAARVGAGELVAVSMDGGWQQAAAMLGIFAAGAAYLPLNRHLPEARARALLERARVKHIYTQPNMRAAYMNRGGLAVHTLDEQTIAPATQLFGDTLPAPTDLAYVIFTCAAAGAQRGAMIDHRGAVNTVLDVNARFGIGAQDRTLAVSALHLDRSVYDVFGPLAAGGVVVIPAQRHRLDPRHWHQCIERHRVTLWNATPGLTAALIDAGECVHGGLHALRHVWLSGDRIPPRLPDRIRRYCPNAAVVSLSGAPEASIWSTYYSVGTAPTTGQNIPYGRALAGQSVYVLDDALQPCPTWVTGDLYIAGIGLARGYWRDAAQTRTAFITHPRTGERLYRTGERGRLLPDGNIDGQACGNPAPRTAATLPSRRDARSGMG